MKPRLVLSLWRERWGKPDAADLEVPYVQGKIDQWGRRLAQASIWSSGLFSLVVSALCLSTLALAVSIRFSLHDQVVVSALLACTALYLRQYGGTLVTLVLAALSLISSLRYLVWRFEDTLSHTANLEFMLGFGLCVAEMYLVLTWAVEFARRVWPLKQLPVSLPENRTAWPSVDIFILAHGRPAPAVAKALTRAQTLEWPSGKLKIHLLDGVVRENIKSLAETGAAVYVTNQEGFAGEAAVIRQALLPSSGELVAILDCDYPLEKHFLSIVGGWFVRDAGLGLLSTPYHLLAPEPTRQSLRLCGALDVTGSCAILRRSALLHAGASEPAFDATYAHTASALRTLRYGTAYLVQDDQEEDNELHLSAAPSAQPLVRLNHPFSAPALWLKQKLHQLRKILRFYSVLPRLVLLTAPLAYLMLGAQLIQSSVEMLAAFAVPHLLHAYLLQSRLKGPRRLSLWTEAREVLLACYLLIPTTFNLVRTACSHAIAFLHSPRWREEEGVSSKVGLWPYAIALVLNLAGLMAGILRLPEVPDTEIDMAFLYLAWCGVNVLLLSSAIALAKEAMHIRRHVSERSTMPAMIRLPYGRTVACRTANFPETDLLLQLPMTAPAGPPSRISVSIFYEHRDFTYDARVLSQEGQMLQVRIERDDLARFKALGASVLSRGQDWPAWLAGRNADRPIPAWITHGIKNLVIATLDFFTNLGQHVKWLSPDNWIRNWKKRND